jgi:hypothetical protein
MAQKCTCGILLDAGGHQATTRRYSTSYVASTWLLRDESGKGKHVTLTIPVTKNKGETTRYRIEQMWTDQEKRNYCWDLWRRSLRITYDRDENMRLDGVLLSKEEIEMYEFLKCPSLMATGSLEEEMKRRGMEIPWVRRVSPRTVIKKKPVGSVACRKEKSKSDYPAESEKKKKVSAKGKRVQKKGERRSNRGMRRSPRFR